MAQDKGFPPLSRTVEVQIDVVDRANNPPVWDHTVYGPIYIRENLPVGAKVVSVKARCVANCSARAPHAAPTPARSVRRRGARARSEPAALPASPPSLSLSLVKPKRSRSAARRAGDLGVSALCALSNVVIIYLTW